MDTLSVLEKEAEIPNNEIGGNGKHNIPSKSNTFRNSKAVPLSNYHFIRLQLSAVQNARGIVSKRVEEWKNMLSGTERKATAQIP